MKQLLQTLLIFLACAINSNAHAIEQSALFSKIKTTTISLLKGTAHASQSIQENKKYIAACSCICILGILSTIVHWRLVRKPYYEKKLKKTEKYYATCQRECAQLKELVRDLQSKTVENQAEAHVRSHSSLLQTEETYPADLTELKQVCDDLEKECQNVDKKIKILKAKLGVQ